jgi:hypothetical protein
MTVPKRLLAVMLGAFVVVAFTACGDDGGSDDASDTTDEAADGGTCDPAAAEDDLLAAMNSFLSEPEAEDKVVSVENGDEYVEFLDETGQISADMGLTMPDNPTIAASLTVDESTETDATFTFALAYQNAPDDVLIELPGSGVCVDGEWLVTGATVCDLSAQGPFPADLIDSCYETAGVL